MPLLLRVLGSRTVDESSGSHTVSVMLCVLTTKAYAIEVRNEETNIMHTITKRYSLLRDFHKQVLLRLYRS